MKDALRISRSLFSFLTWGLAWPQLPTDSQLSFRHAVLILTLKLSLDRCILTSPYMTVSWFFSRLICSIWLELSCAKELMSLMKLELRSNTLRPGAHNFLKGLTLVILLFQSQSSSSWGICNVPSFSIELMLLPPRVIDLSWANLLFETTSIILGM